jgi:hypothetical protein
VVQHSNIDHTGLTGVSTLSYASNANAVSSVSAAGASTLVSRADHVHLGVRSISHTSNTYSGPIILTNSGIVGITSPTPGTLNISAAATGGSGSGSTLARGITRLTSGDLTTTSTSFTDATGVSVTLTTGARRCLVIFSGAATHSATNPMAFDIDVDGARLGETFGLTTINASAAGFNQNVSFTALTGVLSAGSHTIKLQWRVTAGEGTLYASTSVLPAILTVLETEFTT